MSWWIPSRFLRKYKSSIKLYVNLWINAWGARVVKLFCAQPLESFRVVFT